MDVGVHDFVNNLQNVQCVHDRRVMIKLYLASSMQSKFHVPITIKKSEFLKYGSRKEGIPKYNKYRYAILTVLLEEIRNAGGTVNKKVQLQLASDFTKRDIEEICYHIYKPALSSDKILELFSIYAERYNDKYFTRPSRSFTYTKNRVALIASDQSVSTFFYLKDGKLNTCKIGNAFNCKKLKAYINNRITDTFVVATLFNIEATFGRLGVVVDKKLVKSIKFINTQFGVNDIYINIIDDFIIERCD
uniref:Uncharacterized protein n=1 Tax=Penaeus monodon nucleopolyhedrovirus TaxID=259389 RepID=A4UN90_9BACU|nr:hypothetical protein [Penaeus monodon nucleopolyhedrovirus]